MGHLFSLLISLALGITGLGLGAKRMWFLSSAERTSGVVEDLEGYNSRCGGKNSKYDCTKFSAAVKFTSKTGSAGHLTVDAGSTRGNDQSTTHASRPVGSNVAIVYDPNDVTEAFEDSFMALWMWPAGSLGASVLFLVSALRRRR